MTFKPILFSTPMVRAIIIESLLNPNGCLWPQKREESDNE